GEVVLPPFAVLVPWRAGGPAQQAGQCLLELAFGVLRGDLGAPGDEAVGANQQRAVRTDPVRYRALNARQLHPETIRIERYAQPPRDALRGRDPCRPVGPGEQHEASSVQVDGGDPPAI